MPNRRSTNWGNKPKCGGENANFFMRRKDKSTSGVNSLMASCTGSIPGQNARSLTPALNVSSIESDEATDRDSAQLKGGFL